MLTLCSLLLALSAAAPERSGAPYFLPHGAKGATFPLRENRAQIQVDGIIARVRLRQVYENTHSAPIEATYVFPASSGAAIFALRATLAGRTLEARIAERGQAEATYARAKEEGRTAALLTEERPNTLTMKVAPIPPGAKVEVELDYSERVPMEDGVYELVLPTVVGPRYPDGAPEAWVANPHLSAGERPSYHFQVSARLSGMPVRALSSPSHRIETRFEGGRDVRVETSDDAGGDRDFILRYRLDAEGVQAGALLLPPSATDAEGYFLFLATPPAPATPAPPLPREYVFVVDVSGSMSGFPFELAQSTVRRLVEALTPDDRFNLVLFAAETQLLSERSLPATRPNLEHALAVLAEAGGAGGTELLPALDRALRLPRDPDRATSVLLLTDGYVTVEKEAFALVRQSLGRASLFTFGMGRAVNRALIEGLARAGMGQPFVVTSPAEAEEVSAAFCRYVAGPQLRQARFQVEGLEVMELEPEALPDLYPSRPLLVFGKYRGAPRGRFVLTAVGRDGPVRVEHTLTGQEASDDHQALRHLWAKERVGRWLDEHSVSPSGELESKIRALGLAQGLLTPFTAFVAVDRRPSTAGGPVREIRQPLPLPAGVPETALGQQGLLGLSGSSGSSVFGIGGLGLGGSGIGGGGGHGLGGRGKSAVQIRPGKVEIRGSLSREVISRVIRSRQAAFGYCYEKARLRDPELRGKVVLALTVGADGTVLDLKLETELGAGELLECLTTQVKRMRFPPISGGGVVIIRYPLLFASDP